MKKNIICNIAIFLMAAVYSENFSLSGKYIPDLYTTLSSVIIQDEEVCLKYEIELPSKSLAYKKSYRDGLLFFEFSEELPKNIDEEVYYEGKDGSSGNDMLVLAGKSISKGEVLFFGITSVFSDSYPFIYPSHRFLESSTRVYTNCSSFLKEKNVDYSVDNLDKTFLNSPWVEGVKGNGIGEGFTINNTRNTVYSYLLLMNGYISYDKPYLYKQNNRIKKMKVTGLKSGKTKILDVLDTPHPQTVDISFITEPEDIRVEIADVYKGTKYDDTCLHYCITYDAEVIPYEDSIAE